MMLLRVPTGIGLLPCTATITCRPFGWRLAEAVFAQHLNNVFSAANGKALAHVSATSSTFAPADNVTGAGSNQSSKASLALRTASSSVSPAEAHPGNSGKNAAQRLVSESCSTTSRSFIAAILTPCAVCGKQRKGRRNGSRRLGSSLSTPCQKKAHARPFKDRFLKYNENIFFDGLRWSDFHCDCSS